MTTTTTRTDVYTRVTDRIVAELEAGVRPWLKPWNPPGDPRPETRVLHRLNSAADAEFASGLTGKCRQNFMSGSRQVRSIAVNPRRYFDRESNEWKDAPSFNPSDLRH
jgi:hypothetical protein